MDKEHEKKYHQIAVITSHLDTTIRLIKPSLKSDKVISLLFSKLSEAVQPILIDIDTNINIEDLPKSKLYNKDIIECIETGITYTSVAEAARDIGINSGSIFAQINGKIKLAGGYTWRFCNTLESIRGEDNIE